MMKNKKLLLEINTFCCNYRLSNGLLDSLHARRHNPSTDIAGIQPSACSNLNNVQSTQSCKKKNKVYVHKVSLAKVDLSCTESAAATGSKKHWGCVVSVEKH